MSTRVAGQVGGARSGLLDARGVVPRSRSGETPTTGATEESDSRVGVGTGSGKAGGRVGSRGSQVLDLPLWESGVLSKVPLPWENRNRNGEHRQSVCRRGVVQPHPSPNEEFGVHRLGGVGQVL